MVAGAVIRQGVVSAIAFGSIERSLVIRDGVVVTNLSRVGFVRSTAIVLEPYPFGHLIMQP